MRRMIALTTVIAAIFAASAGAVARSVSQLDSAPQKCLDATNGPTINGSSITQGLGLTADQRRELRARLSEYGSLQGFKGFGGIGLTAPQIATMKQRLAAEVAKNTHPLGWPCPAFKNRARTAAFVRALLIGNGFASYTIRFYGSAPRQIQVSGTLNGVRYAGAVARSGVRQITLQLSAPDVSGDTQVFATPFDA